jgi:hypothetical protein
VSSMAIVLSSSCILNQLSVFGMQEVVPVC